MTNDLMRYLHPVPCRDCHALAGEPCRTLGKGTHRCDHATREQDRARAESQQADAENAAAILVACIYCTAPAGEVCRTTMGTIDRAGRPHQVRVIAGRRAARLAADPAQESLL